MAADDQSGARPAGPVVLRIKLRYDDLDTMVLKFAANVGKSGLFLPTKSMQPIGTEVKFELRLSNDTPVLVGLGRVKHVRPPDPAKPKATFGMAIELMRVSREGREVIIRMIERRRVLGLPEVAIPIPDDGETARRSEADSQPRADTSGIVREAMRDFASAPVAEQVLSGPVSAPVSAPIAVAKEEPRRSVAALAPEPLKPKRPRAADLMAQVSDLAGLSTVETPGLDAHVDVERALVRARALAGTDLDRELAALGEMSAAPLEISIEAASAELARQLGGKPIAKRDRSIKTHAAPLMQVPAPIAPSPQADSFGAKTRAETESSQAAVLAAVTASAVAKPTDVAPVEPLPAAPVEVASSTATPIADTKAERSDDDSVAEFAVDDKTRVPTGDDYQNAFFPARTLTSVASPGFAGARSAELNDPDDSLEIPVEIGPPGAFAFVSEDQLRTQPGTDLRSMLIDDAADEGMLRRALEGSSPALKLDDSDLEEIADDEPGDSTHIGGLPIDFPHAPDDLSARLDRELAEAEAEAENEFREIAGDSPAEPYAIQPAQYPESYAEVPAEGGEEISDFDVLAEADAGDADLLHAHHGEPAYVDAAPDLPHYSDPAEAAAPVFPDEVPGYMEPLRPSQEDFAERLDLDDEPDDEEERRNFPTANPRPRSRSDSRGDAYPPAPAFAEPFSQRPSAGFAAQGPIGEDFDEPHGFTQNTPVPASRAPSSHPSELEQPARARSASRMPQPVPDEEDPIDRALQSFDEPSHPQVSLQPPTEDLEDALAALDVDLDPQVQEQRRVRRQTGSQRPLPGLPLQRETGQTPLVPERRTRTTGAHVIHRGGQKPGTMPPPIPVAARRGATTPPPLPVAPPVRGTTEDGIVIDFDDDE